MADSTTWIPQIVTSQAQKEVTANGLFDAASPAMTFGRRQEACAGLQWGYHGGRIGTVSVAAGTVSLAASAVNYIGVNRSTGALAVSLNAAAAWEPATYARLYLVTTGAASVSSWEDRRFGRLGLYGSWLGSTTEPERVEIAMPIGDIATALTTGAGKAYFRARSSLYIIGVRASVATASSSGAPAFNVKVNGATIFAITLTIDANEKTSVTAAAAHAFVSGGQAIADDDEITLDCDTAGTGAAGAVVTLICLRGVADPYFDLLSSRLHMDGSNGSTTFTDVTGRTWSRAATVISTAQSVFGGASAYFNGASRLATASSSAFDARRPFTLSMRVRYDAFTNNNFLWSMGTGSANRLVLYTTGGKLRLYTALSGSGADRIVGASLTANTWYAVLLSYDGTTYRLFQDGALVGTYAGSTAYSGACDVAIGFEQYIQNSIDYLTGYIDELSYWSGIALQTAAYTPATRAHVDA